MNEESWTPPHEHESNPHPPSQDPTITLETAGRLTAIPIDDLAALPRKTVPDCLIVSTGHGPSGPFSFTGVPLGDLIARYVRDDWATAIVLSGDGFGAMVTAEEADVQLARPVLLALEIDGRPLEREDGLVRLIMPNENEDALRQVKWIEKIRVR